MIQNKDVLTSLRTNFDKPEQMKELQKKLLCKLQSQWLCTWWAIVGEDSVKYNIIINIKYYYLIIIKYWYRELQYIINSTLNRRRY